MSASTTIEKLPIKTRKKALKLQKKIETLKKRLIKIAGDVRISGAASPAKSAKVDGRKGKRSAAVRAKMAAAAKARWAKLKG